MNFTMVKPDLLNLQGPHYEFIEHTIKCVATGQICGKNSVHFSSISAPGGRLCSNIRGRMRRMNRETTYTATSMKNITTKGTEKILYNVLKVLFLDLAVALSLVFRTTIKRGVEVINIADALQSHLSAAFGKVEDQRMMWMAPNMPITPNMVQSERSKKGR